MIKLENTEVFGWEATIRGMRNPMNSWEKSDSDWLYECLDDVHKCPKGNYIIGPNDHDLMMKLANGGSVHAKYRRMITVYVDITAPLYWWKEFDTYKVGTVANSCSTMHKIAEKEFTLEDFSTDHLTEYSLSIIKDLIWDLNNYRTRYNKENNSELKKDIWWQMIQLLPTCYNQRRTVMLNYEVLAGIYSMRKDHKLDEWREFCEWIKQLPYSEIIIND